MKKIILYEDKLGIYKKRKNKSKKYYFDDLDIALHEMSDKDYKKLLENQDYLYEWLEKKVEIIKEKK